MSLPNQRSASRRVAISVSDNEDLLALGYSELNLNDACLRIVRSLLGSGVSVAYGGMLGIGDFTRTMLELSRHELRSQVLAGTVGRAETPFYNYQPWPLHLATDAETKKRDAGVCTYVPVDDRQDAGTWDGPPPPTRFAHALSRMRRRMAAETAARVVIGGKVSNFSGIMPGILEETLFHLELRRPVYIVGGFGGAGRALADGLIHGLGDPLPAALDRAQFQGQGKFDELLEGYPEEPSALPHDVTRAEAQASYERLRFELERLRLEGQANGLKPDQNDRLMTTQEPQEMVELISEGLAQLS